MITKGSESENGLFAATVTTGAMAAMAAASFGFYTMRWRGSCYEALIIML